MEQGDKLKCLHITTIDLTAWCFLRSWFSFLMEKGFDLTLATTVQEFKEEIEATGARVVNIPIARSVNPVSDMVSLIRLYRFMKKEKFSSVQTYTTKAGFIGRLAARLAEVPVVIHYMFEPPHNSARNPILKALYIWMERLAAGWADHVFTLTNPNLTEILDKKILPREKLSVIPVGLVLSQYDAVDADPKHKRRELGIPEDARMILTVARLEAPKGHTFLIKAAPKIIEQFPDVYFACPGKGRLMESLKEQAREAGVAERFIFPGFRADMLEILKSCDLFVLPSLWEGQGVATMEAMILKKPVVASRVGGVTDVVEEGVSGILIPPGDSETLADAVIVILKDPIRMEKMAEAGYDRIRKYFLESEFNRERYKIYQNLFKKKLDLTI